MPVVTLDAISNGDAADATPVHNNFQELQSAVNGLDTNNWASGLIFAPSKIMQESATSGQTLVWSGSAWAPSALAASGISQGGATTGQVLAWNGTAWAAATAATVLGSVTYDPTTVTTASTTSATGADIDATNLSLTITLPGTKMLAIFNAVLNAATGGITAIEIGLRESTTNIGYEKLSSATTTTLAGMRYSIHALFTGLTAGSHTYKAALRSIGGVSISAVYGTQATPAAADPGPFNMTLLAVP